ncbi:hypothetical protein CIP107527_02142 [Corynebacterium diphtheriae]|nr:hypothetical protein CIP107527_02142 [Corynebacterium diphtheriae]
MRHKLRVLIICATSAATLLVGMHTASAAPVSNVSLVSNPNFIPYGHKENCDELHESFSRECRVIPHPAGRALCRAAAATYADCLR